jgi:hypothetical protein
VFQLYFDLLQMFWMGRLHHPSYDRFVVKTSSCVPSRPGLAKVCRLQNDYIKAKQDVPIQGIDHRKLRWVKLNSRSCHTLVDVRSRVKTMVVTGKRRRCAFPTVMVDVDLVVEH